MSLELKNISKEFGDLSVINNISYSFDNGVYGLLGTNGVGKTTLIRMICSLNKPTKGEILYNGENIETLGASYRDDLGYLPQEFGFYKELSIYEYMMYIASIKGIKNKVAKKRIKYLLEKVSLLEMKKRKMGTLSGGMQRRVGIAQAMLNDPKVLILDEPTAGLDPKERIKFRNLISDLAEDRLVILSTHIVSDVEFIAKKIILMKDGEFHFTGSLSKLLEKMEGKVWIVNINDTSELSEFEHYFIVNKRYGNNGSLEIRIISDIIPREDAIMVGPTLEDACLYSFGEDLDV